MHSPFPPATVRGEVPLPLRLEDGTLAQARVLSFDGLLDGREHVAIALGDRAEDVSPDRGASTSRGAAPQECFTGDVLGSRAVTAGAAREAASASPTPGETCSTFRRRGGASASTTSRRLRPAGQGDRHHEANLALGFDNLECDFTVAARSSGPRHRRRRLLTNNPASGRAPPRRDPGQQRGAHPAAPLLGQPALPGREGLARAHPPVPLRRRRGRALRSLHR